MQNPFQVRILPLLAEKITTYDDSIRNKRLANSVKLEYFADKCPVYEDFKCRPTDFTRVVLPFEKVRSNCTA